MRARQWGVFLVLVAAALLWAVAPASARQVQRYFYSGNTFDAGSSGAQAIAFDNLDQKVLVASNTGGAGTVSLFTPTGLTAPFTGAGGNASLSLPLPVGENFSSASRFSIAVDDSGGAAAGNFYVATTSPSKLYRYKSDGTLLPGFPLTLAFRPCGVGVGPDGGIWVADPLLGKYQEFSASGGLTGKILAFGRAGGGCDIAFDTQGNIFAAKAGRVVKYDPITNSSQDFGAIFPYHENSVSEPLESNGSPLAFDRADNTLFALIGNDISANRITQFDSSGSPIAEVGAPDPAHFSYPGLHSAHDLAIDPQTHDVYALKSDSVEIFSREPATVTVPTVETTASTDITGTGVMLHGTVDPDGVDTTDCHFEWGATLDYGHSVACSEGNIFAGGSGVTAVSATIGGLSKGMSYHYRLVAGNAPDRVGFGRDVGATAADPPLIGDASVSHVTTDSARIRFDINPNGGTTGYHVEVVGVGNFPDPDVQLETPGTNGLGGLTEAEANLVTRTQTQEVSGLAPDTTYTYRVVGTNAAGVTQGAVHVVHTFSTTPAGDSCSNAHVRQQTGASLLLDCRAYELVSANYTGGYDVRSDLSTGVAPLSAAPEASDRALYSMQSGTIPGVAGNPTNRGADPYVATRGPDGWSTKYVGIPANAPSNASFASTLAGTDSALGTFAFGGPDICSPCFSDGSAGTPVRKPDGSLVQGMTGPVAVAKPVSAGTVKKSFSDDGGHFIFGSKQRFVEGANNNGSDATIYDRNLTTNTTQIASTTPAGAPIANGVGIAELDISGDGSRIVIGQLISTDAAGNSYYHLYMHVGSSPNSIDLTPGATNGVLYDGMTGDGTIVYFTTKDALTTAADQDHDTSADIYRADVGSASATLSRVSVGEPGSGDTDLCNPVGTSARAHWNSVSITANCDAVAIGAAGGVAAGDGTIYFLSPERLDTSGPVDPVQDLPNLYMARPGAAPRFVATLESIVNGPQPPPTELHFSGNFGSFATASGIAVDHSSGDVYALDIASFGAGSNRLYKFDAEGHPLNFTEGAGSSTNQLNGSDAPTGSFSQGVGRPTEIAVDPASGDIYVPDYNHNVVDVFKSTGAYDRQIAVPTPSGVAVQAGTHNLYVADFGDEEVKVFTPAGAPVSSFHAFGGASSLAVESDGTIWTVTAAFAVAYKPTGEVKESIAKSFKGVTVDPVTDDVYLDQGDRVLQLDASGKPTGGTDGKGAPFGIGILSGSVGVAVDSGSMYASNQNGKSVARFATVVTPSLLVDNPLVLHSVGASGARHPEDFQVNPTGTAVFATGMQLAGNPDNSGRYELYRYDAASHGLACVSCIPTLARPGSDTFPSAYGLSLTDDGRVFFTSAEALALRDSNERKDAYEWEGGNLQLISTGTSQDDTTLLSASSDGKNAFFFTREQLVPADENGNAVRLYTARENGGFSFGPPEFQCAASDECHGPSSPPPPPASVGTSAGAPHQFRPEAKPCRKGKVRRHGRCVAKHHRKESPKKTKQRGGK